MTLLASTWLLLAVVMCGFAWIAGKRLAAISLPLAVVLSALAIYVPTGSPRYTAPPAGDYTVLGADIEVDVAIYALLQDKGGKITFYKLPYSTSQANALQQALDGAQNGQGVKAKVDGEGGVSYDGDPPVAGDPPKHLETPQVSIP